MLNIESTAPVELTSQLAAQTELKVIYLLKRRYFFLRSDRKADYKD